MFKGEKIGIGDLREGDNIVFDDSEVGGAKGFGKIVYITDTTLVPAPGFYVWKVGYGLYPDFPVNIKKI